MVPSSRVRAAFSVALLAITFVSSSTASAQRPSSSTESRDPPPGEGIVCAWALYSVAAQVAARCFPGENPALEAELRNSVTKLDAYVARNSKDATPANIEKFKQEQGGVGAPVERLCKGDAVMVYRAFERAGPDKLRLETDKATARDGPPSWGTCL